MEYNAYQSPVWIHIQREIYKRHFEQISLGGKSYRCQIRGTKQGHLHLQRYQILGVEIPDDKNGQEQWFQSLKEYTQSLQKKKGVIFLQLGIINRFYYTKNKEKKSDTDIKKIKSKREEIQKKMKERGLHIAFKENMPLSTIIYSLNKTDEEFIQEMSSNCKNKIKKAKKLAPKLLRATPEDRDDFYTKRKATSIQKGFSIITKEDFFRLAQDLQTHKHGEIIVTKLEGKITSGAIYLIDKDTAIYLYGFSDRAYQNKGMHHFLHYSALQFFRDQGIKQLDALGGAPTGYPDHHLIGVSEFKEALGGEKEEFYGNFDVIFSPITYYLLKFYHLFKKWKAVLYAKILKKKKE